MGHPGGIGCRRDLDIEDGPLPVVGLDPDPPAHPPDELAGDVEAEPGAPDASGHVGVEAVELLDDPVALRGWDPEAHVGHREPHPPVALLDAETDVPAGRRVLDGVLQQVVEHLPQLSRVGCDRRHGVADGIELETNAFGKMRPRGLGDALGERACIAALDAHVEPARVNLAHEQQVVDDRGEALRLVHDHVQQPRLQVVAELEVVSAARFHNLTTPSVSTRKTPSPTVSSTRADWARSSTARYSCAFSTAVPARRASSSASARSSGPYRRPDSAATSEMTPSTSPCAMSGTHM